jgi:hypothetical protein
LCVVRGGLLRSQECALLPLLAQVLQEGACRCGSLIRLWRIRQQAGAYATCAPASEDATCRPGIAMDDK